MRESSPRSGCSTLTTSAPSAARICVQEGPATELVTSTTRTPDRGRNAMRQSSRMFHSLVDAISASAWAYPIVFAVAFLDSFFPVVPSETVVITGGVLAGSGKLTLELVVVAAAFGAWFGDNFAYLLGHLFGEPLERRLLRG